ncbi:MAG: hypothetical protein IT168_04035 [Bryobacterales bacterium]|nr:hypothetical protein [Bryobacterales bacterium]
MMSENHDGLQHLLERYRSVCPDVEPTANFMPGLWDRIESRRGFSWKLKVYSRAIASAAAALCFAVMLLQFGAFNGSSSISESTYLEALEADHAPEQMAYNSVLNADESSAITPTDSPGSANR